MLTLSIVYRWRVSKKSENSSCATVAIGYIAPMTTNEKLIGIEAMKSRIETFHAARLSRIGMEWKMDAFRTSGWSRAKVIKEFRALPENIDCKINAADAYDPANPPTQKTDAEMAQIIKSSRITITL